MNFSQKKHAKAQPSSITFMGKYQKYIPQPCFPQMHNFPEADYCGLSLDLTMMPWFPLHALPNTTMPCHHVNVSCHDTHRVTDQWLSSQHNAYTLVRSNLECCQVMGHPNCNMRSRDSFFPNKYIRHDVTHDIRAGNPNYYLTMKNAFRPIEAHSSETHGSQRARGRMNSLRVFNPYFHSSQDSQQSASHQRLRYSKDAMECRKQKGMQLKPPGLRRKPKSVYEAHWTKEQIIDGLEKGSLLSVSLPLC